MPDLKELQSRWRYKTNLHKKKKARQIGSSVWVGGTGHGFIRMANHLISVRGTVKLYIHTACCKPSGFPGQRFRDPGCSHLMPPSSSSLRQRERGRAGSPLTSSLRGPSTCSPSAGTSHTAPNKLQGRLGNGGHIAMDEMSENETSGLGYTALSL